MGNVNFKDVRLPFTADGSGGLETVESRELASQRILYGYATTEGAIVHRPRWFGALEEYQGAKGTPETLQLLRNQARRFLATLPFLRAYDVEITADGDSITIRTQAKTDEGDLMVPEVTI